MKTATIIADGRSPNDQANAPSGADLMRALCLGDRQAYGALAVYPLLPRDASAFDDSLEYITLHEGLSSGDVTISEVSDGGSIEEVRVLNRGDARVLVYEGEELLGARQNRISVTTILVEAHSLLIMPVNCGERGRWDDCAPMTFTDSDIVAERGVRYAMKDSLHASLLAGTGHRAAQGRTWETIERLHRRHQTASPTRAWRDSYASRMVDLDGVLRAFPLVEGQIGVLVMTGERVVGLDAISRSSQYAQLHEKILRSYALEGLVRTGEAGDTTVAEEFLARIKDTPGRRFKSPGLGWDVRYESDRILGSALVLAGRPIAAAFFDVAGVTDSADDKPGNGRPSWSISDARDRARRREAR